MSKLYQVCSFEHLDNRRAIDRGQPRHLLAHGDDVADTHNLGVDESLFLLSVDTS